MLTMSMMLTFKSCHGFHLGFHKLSLLREEVQTCLLHPSIASMLCLTSEQRRSHGARSYLSLLVNQNFSSSEKRSPSC